MDKFTKQSGFHSLLDYLESRSSGLKYWRGQGTTKCQNYSDQNRNKPGPNRRLSRKEELFLVLIKLKSGYQNNHLSHLFNISESLVSQVLSTWINFLSVELKYLFELPCVPNDITMDCFQDFPNLKIVIDCTELELERASNLQARKETWSNYKQRDTVKFMIGLSPYLCVNYVSVGYGGRASDKKITSDSEALLSWLSEGDQVMADRGFDVGDMLQGIFNLDIL